MRILLAGVLLILIVSCTNSEKEKKVASKHSDAFNASVQSAMDSYHALTEAFVNWDSARVVSETNQLQTKLYSLKLDELKNEVRGTAIGFLDLAKKDLQAITSNNSIVNERQGLNSLTQNIYGFLDAVQYDEKKIYLQECPMAFNDSIPGDWLSETDSIRNPYMGLHHPHYGSAMIECGSTKSTIDFTSKKQ